uniref:Uncharacterized protein n=1 Tax=Romanomermis culicivorax TaxID=13658 RepID=A0A915K7D0_ROMCU
MQFISNVVKTTVLLADMNDFTMMNSIYKECKDFHSDCFRYEFQLYSCLDFEEPFPARAAYQVAKLPK